MSQDFSKLPKWAQEYIAELQRQHETAVRALKEYVDHQTPSRIFFEDMICIQKGAPDFFKVYIQAARDEVTFDLDMPKKDRAFAPRENQVTVRIDREDPTQILISAAWNRISLYPIASNTIALKGVRS